MESATLKVNDQSTAQIKKINAALKDLFKTAKSLKSVSINIKINDKGVQSAIRNMRSLQREMNRLGGRGGTTRLNVSVNTSGITAAVRQIQNLRAQAQRPINVRTAAGRGAPGTGVPRAPTAPRAPAPVRPQRTFVGGAAAAAASGFGRGLGGIGRLAGAFYGVETAAYAAARGLRSVGEAGYERSRSELRTKALTTAAQQEEAARIKQEGVLGKGAPLPWTTAQRESFINDIRADVGDSLKDLTPQEQARMTPAQLQERELQAQRNVERNARAIADYFEKQVYPGIYARTGKTPEQALEGQSQLVRAINIASAELTAEGKPGALSPDFKRVVGGIQLALATGTEIKPGVIKTVIAGVKTAGFTFGEEAIAQMIVQASDVGQRVGNEQFRALRAFAGGIDNKTLNNALAAQGFLIGAQRNKKGNVIAGTGRVIDEDTFRRYPGKWLQDRYGKEMADLEVKTQEQRIAAARKALGPGATEEQIAEDAKARLQVARVAFLERKLPGMPQTALNAVNQWMLGWEQWQRTFAQAQRTRAQDAQLPGLIAESPAAQWDRLKTAVWEAAGTAASSAANFTNLAGILGGMADIVSKAAEQPISKEGAIVGGAVVAGGAAAGGLAYSLWSLGTAGPALNTAAAAHIRAAAALTTAAGAQRAGAAAGAAAAGGAAAGGAAAGGAAAGGAAAGAATRKFGWRMLGRGALRAAGPIGTAIIVHEVISESVPQEWKDTKTAADQLTAAKTLKQNAEYQKARYEKDLKGATTEAARERATKKIAEFTAQIDAANAAITQLLPTVKPAEAAKQAEAAKAAEAVKPAEPTTVKVDGTTKVEADKPLVTQPSITPPGAAMRPPLIQAQPAPPPTEAKPTVVTPSPEWKPLLVPPPPPVQKVEPDKAVEAKPIVVSPSPEWKQIIAIPPEGRPPTTVPVSETGFDITEFTAATRTFANTPSQFSTVFGTGASTLTQAGTTAGTNAASVLTSAAPGIGATIGNAIASAVTAAVSNINVNVNANVKGDGVDKGGQKAAP